jgi:hypothetical protein
MFSGNPREKTSFRFDLLRDGPDSPIRPDLPDSTRSEEFRAWSRQTYADVESGPQYICPILSEGYFSGLIGQTPLKNTSSFFCVSFFKKHEFRLPLRRREVSSTNIK